MLKVVHFLEQLRTYIYIYIYIGFALLFSILLILLATNSAAFATNIETSVTIKPSLSLNIPTNTIIMNLDPSTHTFDEKDLTVKVGTNNQHGYKLYVSTINNSSDLVNVADNAKIIPNLTNSTSVSNFPVNNWGYRLTQDSPTSSGDYGAFVSNSIISESSTAVNEKVTTMGFAAKIDYSKPSGLYELGLSFKALPIVTQNYMQNLDPNICTEDPTVVIDQRDERPYIIARLKDGNCWMLQNLNLGKNASSTDTITLTSVDSDVRADTGFELTGKSANGKFTYTTISDSAAKGGTADINDSSQYYCNDDYGCYYNWYTATAGAGTSYTTTGNVDYSICPAGWTLPTSGASGQFQTLYNNYPSPEQMLVPNPNTTTENINGESKPGFLLGGNYDANGLSQPGWHGVYWSRTAYSPGYSDYLYIDKYTSSSSVNPQTHHNKYFGMNIRCVLRESPLTINSISTMQEFGALTGTKKTQVLNSMTEGTSYTLIDDREDRANSYTVAKLNGNVWMTSNLKLGYNSSNPNTTTLTLNPANSNVPSSRTLTVYDIVSNGDSTSSYCFGSVNIDNQTGTGNGFTYPCMHSRSTSTEGATTPRDGVWYNYATVTAGNITGTDNVNDESTSGFVWQDICPAGWRLPTNAEGNSISSASYAGFTSFNPVLGGYYAFNSTKSSFDNEATRGMYWLSTKYNKQVRYFIAYDNNNNLYTSYYYAARYLNFYVRCIAKN